ncbi:response regulator transcription factor [Flavitalea sp. BT771]|jgi:DNA-binding NarL/FixJ family response regulator|uniref:response regulator n=1 Tax=Flavitalea sp. BT771 TaxID=3063329 RepID=UPI0026E1877B|nr:response regulator transcription factor [Flavitalea sp. BT771]MDO6433551.1 response regulator transcription factor [Flavitalea sp. BT771]MDV6222544.1 response regulator transcription factor [Flavitalea sp. BT771]
MKKVSIMIVDDHTLIRETWSFLLGKNENFDVVAECGDGERAIELARDKRPDVVLLDINMAPMSGFDVLKMIRKYSPGSKIIGVSMHSQPAYAKKMLRLGAKGYVTKNSPRQEMLEAISEVSNNQVYICQEVKNILSEQMLNGDQVNPDINNLSDREMQIVRALKEGLSSKEIASDLNISLKTVEVHRHNILKKLKLKNTVSLINFINSQAFDI